LVVIFLSLPLPAKTRLQNDLLIVTHSHTYCVDELLFDSTSFVDT